MKLSKICYWILPALAVFSMSSCKKQDSLGYTPGTGAPTITSVKTTNKYIQDTVLQTTITYSSSGDVTTKVDTNFNHQSVIAFDSTTVTGNLGTMYMITGTNLGSATKLTINDVNIYYNRSWGSDNSIIFTLPTNIPYVQPQSNNIVVTTLHGSVTYKFTTLPPPPTIIQVSDFDFWSNSQITLTGKGFASVSSVKFKTTGEDLSITSQNDSTLVLQMPAASTATESALLFTYTSGSDAGAQAASSTVFNNLDKGYIIFKDNFQNSWGDNSWSGPSGVSTAASHSGTTSLVATYPSNGWKIEGWANWYPSFAYDASYKYLTFWVKGGSEDHTLTLVGDKMVGGYGQNQSPEAVQQITVPKNVWTFYKIPLGTKAGQLNFWANGSPAANLGFFLLGKSSDTDQTMYFDEVAFLK